METVKERKENKRCAFYIHSRVVSTKLVKRVCSCSAPCVSFWLSDWPRKAECESWGWGKGRSLSLFLSRFFLFFCPFTPCLYLTRTEDRFSPWGSSRTAAFLHHLPFLVLPLSASSSSPSPVGWLNKRSWTFPAETGQISPKEGVAEEQEGGWHLRGEASFLFCLSGAGRKKDKKGKGEAVCAFQCREAFFFPWISFYSPCFVSPLRCVPCVGTKVNYCGQDFHNSKRCVYMYVCVFVCMFKYRKLGTCICFNVCLGVSGRHQCFLFTPSQVFPFLIVFLCWL